MARIDELFHYLKEHQGSDLHLAAGIEPRIRVHGSLEPVAGWPVLDDAALARRLDGHPSEMTLGGLLKHLAFVEFFWFEVTAHGTPASEPWVSVDWDADPDWDWHSAAEDSAEDLRALWRESVERSRAVVERLLEAGPAALDATHPAWGGREQVSLRWILTHMIEEYARHNGHADPLREQIDGQVGE